MDSSLGSILAACETQSSVFTAFCPISIGEVAPSRSSRDPCTQIRGGSGSVRTTARPYRCVCSVQVLLAKPMVLRVGTRFFVREQYKTSVTGLVTQILPRTEQTIVGLNCPRAAKAILQTSMRSALPKWKRK